MGFKLKWGLAGEVVHGVHLLGAARAVLTELSVMANDLTRWCQVSTSKLAELCGNSVRHIRRVLRWLELRGIVEVETNRGVGRSNRYRLVQPEEPAAPCGQPVREAGENRTSRPLKSDMTSAIKEEEKKEEKLAPKQPVDKSRSWSRGFSHLSGFFATSSCASSAPAGPCRPGGSPIAGLPPFTPPARSTTPSGGSSSATSSARSGSGSVADLVAEFLAERQGTPGARPGW